MLFDTHAHFYDAKFDPDRDEILSSMKAHNVGYIINAGCDVESTQKSIALAEKYDFIYAASGVHPNHTEGLTKTDYDKIESLAHHEKVRAIGEIGLDYHFDTPRNIQRDAFSYQIDMARRLSLPFVIHCREAIGDLISILKSDYKGDGALMHCFSESRESAKILLDMGLFIAIGGTVTFKNNVRTVDAVKYIPLDRLVLETDSPYLAPTPHRGERNSSLNIHLVCEKIAEIKGISAEEVETVTTENAKNFFKIK